jgi:hypothetical protein
MVAPEIQQPSEWRPLRFKDRPPEPDPQDEDAVDAYVSKRYEAFVRLPRGKYEVEFRVENKAGNFEECSNVIMIVADAEDYGL